MLNGRWVEFRRTGFGIVVVGRGGALLACGGGAPPAWCHTAAAAEAWALMTVVTECTAPPRMRTDCNALLDTLVAGVEAATAPTKTLARIWFRIAHALDGDFGALVASGCLVWMPAHQTARAIGEVKLSDGTRLTAVDWRANRLADALAKQEAGRDAATAASSELRADAAQAVRHAAALLGRTTFAANHHVVQVCGEDGVVRNVVRRDATTPSACPQRRAGAGDGAGLSGDVGGDGEAVGSGAASAVGGSSSPSIGCASTQPVPAAPREVCEPAPLPPPLPPALAAPQRDACAARLRTPAARRAAALRASRACEAAAQEAATERLCALAAARSAAAAPGITPSAAERFEALRERARQREGASDAV